MAILFNLCHVAVVNIQASNGSEAFSNLSVKIPMELIIYQWHVVW